MPDASTSRGAVDVRPNVRKLRGSSPNRLKAHQTGRARERAVRGVGSWGKMQPGAWDILNPMRSHVLDAVYGGLLRFMRPGQSWLMSNERLRRVTGYARSTIYRAINKLVELGLITRTAQYGHKGRQGWSLFTVTVLPDPQPETVAGPPPSPQAGHPTRPQVLPGSLDSDPTADRQSRAREAPRSDEPDRWRDEVEPEPPPGPIPVVLTHNELTEVSCAIADIWWDRGKRGDQKIENIDLCEKMAGHCWGLWREQFDPIHFVGHGMDIVKERLPHLRWDGDNPWETWIEGMAHAFRGATA